MASSRAGAPILVVEPDDASRTELTKVLQRAGFDVVAAATGFEALEAARRVLPSLALLEIPLEDVSGYEVCRSLRDEYGPELSIIFLSGTRREAFDRVAGLLLGADDYLVKPYAVDELLARVRRLVDRQRPMSTSIAGRLTKREIEVLKLLADGCTQEEIAGRLIISPKTVGTHIERILAKLGVHSRAQAVAVAYRDDVVTSAG